MFYNIATALVRAYLRVIFKVTVEGEVPESGAYILCSNHTSYYDPVVVAAFCGRRLSFMAKKELFKNKLFGFLIKKCGAFPVDRSKADIGAVKKSLSILKNGGAMLMFPEGTRVKEGDSSAAKAGMVMFSHKTSAPIIPVGVKSDFKLFSKLHITYGKPITLSEYDGKKLSSEEMADIAADILSEIKAIAKD